MKNLASIRLLQLLSLAEKEEQQIIVKLSFNEYHIQFKWQIDSFTYTHLKKVLHTDDRFRYRLSLVSKWDPVEEQYFSSYTMVHGEYSKKIKFQCSEEYVQHLDWLRTIEDIKSLSKSPVMFLLPDTKENNVCGEQEPSKKKPFYKRFFNGKQKTLIIVIAAIFLTVLMYFINDNGLVFSTSEQSIKETLVESEDQFNPILKDSQFIDNLPFVSSVSPDNSSDNHVQNQITSYIPNTFEVHSMPPGTVALTFDDGPSQYTKDIVDVMNEYDVSATFFFLGENAEKFHSEVVYAHEHGFTIGNHSLTHRFFGDLTHDEIELEISESNDYLESIINRPIKLFRAPYGYANDDTHDILQLKDMQLVSWNRDPKDWQVNSSIEILNYFKRTDPSTGIYIMHETKRTLDVLPAIIEYLQEQELKIVNLD